MEKQDLIKEINKEKYDFSKPETSLNRSDYKEGYNDACDDILDIIFKQLDEPQKVKVPEFVVEWFKENKHNLNFAIYELCEAGKVPVDLYEGLTDFERWFYLNHDIDTLIRMQDGYEVEQEQKWKIINDQKYCLTSIEAGYGNSLHWAFDSTKKKPILFDNEETALYTAYITGGTVEKV
ncbi:DUF1642 domain-containing protein [Enterococcus avium]|uniref:DUF1642 domain-containing protein n=1 Tax=Enterococcus avium TaxID=33945 RepID=UPI00159DBAF7|nr:DUF1642 domain-containing protein [Enterococcus avium]NVN60134.1 DUF1642 domain-containing protein [Enterococcus avium]NVN75222.1 DUF1642 domain-containing protein [Enterococcus avium]